MNQKRYRLRSPEEIMKNRQFENSQRMNDKDFILGPTAQPNECQLEVCNIYYNFFFTALSQIFK